MRRHAATRLLVSGAALAWALTLGLAPQAYAQTSTGTIRGFVRDTEGNPVANAGVIAIQTSTNIQRSALSTASGFFNIPGLQPGEYTIRATSLGFADTERSVRLQIGQTLSLDVELSVQAIALEGLEVQASRIVETRTPEVATNITQDQIENIPINDRNFLSLALLVPGVRSDGGSITSGGQSANNINVFLDGVSFKNDMLVGGVVGQDASQGNPFPQSAVQEFRVITQQYKAEYQKATSTVISATTKSGTNQWEGDVFLFGQNNNLVAKSFIQKRACSDSITRNPDFTGGVCADLGKRDKLQGGLSVGGPILRDRLFFFGTYEGNHITSANTIAPQNVDALRAIRPDLADEVLTHSGTFDLPVRSNLYFGKLTFVPSVGSAHRFEVSTSIRDEHDLRDFNNNVSRDAAVQLQNDVNTFVAKHQYAKSSWVNEFGVSFQNYQWHPKPDREFPNAIELNVNGQRVLTYGARCCTQDWVQDRLSFRDDLTYTKAGWFGDHVFKLGGNYDFVSFDVFQQNNIRPTQRWNNVQNNYAFPYEIVAGFGEPGAQIDNQQLGLYIQDDWNVSARLALNLGLRWDYETNEKNNAFVQRPSDLTALQAWVANLNCSQPSDDPVIKSRQVLCDLDHYTADGTRSAYKKAFQPRIGFSYDLFGDQRTVLFGGAGVYYDRHRLGTFISEINRGKFEQYTFRFSTDGAPVGGNPTIVWDDAYLTREGLATILQNAAIAPGGELHLFADDIKPPHTNQFSAGLRQSFGDYMVTANYSGVRGYDFITMIRANRTATGGLQNNNPIWSNLFYSSQAGRTWYDAMMLKAEKRYTPLSRWGVQLAYTLAKAEENVNPGDRFTNLSEIDDQGLPRYPSNNDERHHITTNWTIGLPFDVRFGGIIDLGSGTPRNATVGFGAGTNACTHGNMDCIAGNDYPPGETRNWWRQPKQTFIFKNAFAFRNVDLRLEKKFPTTRGQQIGIVAEVFNVFDFANFTGYNQNYGTYQIVDGELRIVRTTVCPAVTSAGQPCPVDQVNALGQTTGVVTDLRRFGAPRRFQLGTRYTF